MLNNGEGKENCLHVNKELRRRGEKRGGKYAMIVGEKIRVGCFGPVKRGEGSCVVLERGDGTASELRKGRRGEERRGGGMQ